MKYRLDGVPEMDKGRVPELKKYILDGIKERRGIPTNYTA